MRIRPMLFKKAKVFVYLKLKKKNKNFKFEFRLLFTHKFGIEGISSYCTTKI